MNNCPENHQRQITEKLNNIELLLSTKVSQFNVKKRYNNK